VRIDDIVGSTVQYSYSIDDGSNWIKATAPSSPPTSVSGGYLSLSVPGGYLSLTGPVAPGDQFQIQPHRADIKFQIGETDAIAVNLLGLDVFGGYYNYPQDKSAYPRRVDGAVNLFEAVGKLVAAAECNSTDDMGQAVADLDAVMKLVMTRAADVGGRENRLEITYGALTVRKYSEEDNLSAIEDIDVTELSLRLAQQQTAYSSVLKSSSMIMQMSLLNYL
jgi:flagellar hook-associated protein 3 FlgL